jgi:aminotransferase
MIGYVNDLVYVCAPAPLQFGVASGILELKNKYYETLRAEFSAKRNLLCETLTNVGLMPSMPQGAYYVLANVSHLPGKTIKEKSLNLLGDTGVACVPGNAFFHNKGGENLVRFCFAKNDGELHEACHRLLRLQRVHN